MVANAISSFDLAHGGASHPLHLVNRLINQAWSVGVGNIINKRNTNTMHECEFIVMKTIGMHTQVHATVRGARQRVKSGHRRGEEKGADIWSHELVTDV